VSSKSSSVALDELSILEAIVSYAFLQECDVRLTGTKKKKDVLESFQAAG
jgi:hypothetical protein